MLEAIASNGLPQQSQSTQGIPPQRIFQSSPSLSIIIPGYNEAAVLEDNLTLLYHYMEGLSQQFDWELIVVNDGSRDETGLLAEAFAATHPRVRVVHHRHNQGLGQALRTGFSLSEGDYVITLDLDLSYAPDHIERLVQRMQQTGAKVVVASPYMRGGKVSNVPGFRLGLSVWANRFLSLMSKGQIATLTGMVRAYDGEFVRSLHPRAMGMDINPEVLHKARLLNARVDEIPAHLHWRSPEEQARSRAARPNPPAAKASPAARRRSSMRILRQIWAVVFYGFLFRPVLFFLLPSVLCLGLGLYSGSWAVIHSWTQYQRLVQIAPNPDPTEAVAQAFQHAPHTFVIGGLLMTLGVQLFSLAVLSTQSKYYFEEIFYLGTSIHRSNQSSEPNSGDR